jgi:UDP-2-acetamido-3-amino-2,3-dideoxy-glucuronate N-acetyltransferase
LGKNLIRDFHGLGVLKIICDVNLDFLNKFKGLYDKLETTSDFGDLLKDDEISAICVSLPAELHYKFAKQALLAGKDVYIEKPITLDVGEAQELIDLAEKGKRILMVGHLLHYHPCIEKIKEIISSGKIGKIKNIVCNRLNLGIFRKKENVLWSFAPHDISVILALCGDELPKDVLCTGFCHINNNIHDITNSILFYNDKYVNINVNWLNPYKEQRMSIIGTKGMLCFDDTSKENKLVYYPEYIEYSGDLNRHP